MRTPLLFRDKTRFLNNCTTATTTYAYKYIYAHTHTYISRDSKVVNIDSMGMRDLKGLINTRGSRGGRLKLRRIY